MVQGSSHLSSALHLAAQVTFIQCRFDPFPLLLKTFQWLFIISKILTKVLICLSRVNSCWCLQTCVSDLSFSIVHLSITFSNLHAPIPSPKIFVHSLSAAKIVFLILAAPGSQLGHPSFSKPPGPQWPHQELAQLSSSTGTHHVLTHGAPYYKHFL